MNLRTLMYAGLMLMALPLAQASAENPKDIMVVANRSVSVDQITRAELRDFFLKKRTSWSKGGKVVPINSRKGTSLRKEFRKQVLNMSTSEEDRYWEDKKIKSGVVKPATMSKMGTRGSSTANNSQRPPTTKHKPTTSWPGHAVRPISVPQVVPRSLHQMSDFS